MPIEKISLTIEEATEILDGDSDKYLVVSPTYQFIYQGRWTTTFDALVIENGTGERYLLRYSKGSTEVQDHSPFEYEDAELRPTKIELVERWVSAA